MSLKWRNNGVWKISPRPLPHTSQLQLVFSPLSSHQGECLDLSCHHKSKVEAASCFHTEITSESSQTQPTATSPFIGCRFLHLLAKGKISSGPSWLHPLFSCFSAKGKENTKAGGVAEISVLRLLLPPREQSADWGQQVVWVAALEAGEKPSEAGRNLHETLLCGLDVDIEKKERDWRGCEVSLKC